LSINVLAYVSDSALGIPAWLKKDIQESIDECYAMLKRLKE
jgi:hypothetical protein